MKKFAFLKKNEEPETYLDYEEGEEEVYPDEPLPPRLSFGQKMVIYIAVWVVLILAACGVMWNMMQQYEEAQPWYAVENYITTSGQSAFFSALNDAHPNADNPYESLYEIAGVLSAKYTGRISYKKLIREYTYEQPVYLLYCGEENLLKVTLEQHEETGFLGLLGYRVCKTELVASDLLSFTSYGLVFPTDATVFVNGKALRTEDLPKNSPVQVFGDGAYTACLLENFFAKPTVKVKLNGDLLTPLEGEHFFFDYPEPGMRTLRITAPKGAAVRIDGERVSDFYITGASACEPDRFGATVEMAEYTVPTVTGRGAVTVALDGKALQTETVNEHTSAFPPTESVTIRIPPTAVLYANGEAVETAYVTDMHAAWISDFAGVRGYPESHTYTIDGLYALPSFTAADGGKALTAASDGETTVFICEADTALEETYANAAIAYMDAYLYYTTQGLSNTRQNLNAVKAHVANPSPLYTNLERSYIGYYYIAAQKITDKTITVSNFVPYGDNAFTCDLHYKIALTNWVGEATDENTMRIAFAKQTDGSFMPVNMTLLNQ